MKKKRNRSRPPQPLQERLKQIALGAREKAAGLPPGHERDRLLETGSQPSLRPPSTAGCHHPVCRPLNSSTVVWPDRRVDRVATPTASRRLSEPGIHFSGFT